ncbi:dehydrogenase/reductase [Mycobacterium triplex]|uniref:Dehydrogenase/reductase n=1 Tax=Mycobacterium triplex TaxID=47839 RepID=A0A024JX04_9MYCO|nr:hypothetical protein [Mycobacterium triplex]CDO87748.1 dehydrogenase/reductase [Mycobacterium triplex]
MSRVTQCRREHASLPADDPEYFDVPYRGVTAYARTKRMQVALTPILARHWADDDVRVYAMHPRWSDTPGVATSLPAFRALTGPLLRTPEQGADTGQGTANGSANASGATAPIRSGSTTREAQRSGSACSVIGNRGSC